MVTLGALGAVLIALLVAAALLRARHAPAAVPNLATATAGGSGKTRDPDKARELVQRASEWQAANDTGTARDLLEKAIELDPDNGEAHYRLGGLFLNSQPDRARKEYEAAKRLNPTKYREVVDTILRGL